MHNSIVKSHLGLKNHSLYNELKTLNDLRQFMEIHVFAVWDFMSLLKSLQTKITCTNIPWIDSKYSPKLVRLINEIVLGEESDLDQNGNPSSHFALYLKAMEEIGADTKPIKKFLKSLNVESLPEELSKIVAFHLNIAFNGSTHQVASSFFYGREKLIPDMFQSIVNIIESHNLECPTLIYYFKRHIELDADEHGPMAQECLTELLDTDIKKDEAIKTALASLEKRSELWNYIQKEILKKAHRMGPNQLSN